MELMYMTIHAPGCAEAQFMADRWRELPQSQQVSLLFSTIGLDGQGELGGRPDFRSEAFL